MGTTGGTGRFPQVAGLKYVYNANNPVGKRILSVTVTPSGEPLDPCKKYNVVSVGP